MALTQQPLFGNAVQSERTGRDARLTALRQDAWVCCRCPLSEERLVTVFGEGTAVRPKVLFVAGCPSAEEELAGRPMVGETGLKFDGMLTLLGLTRDEVYCTHLVKCRPETKAPSNAAQETCLKHFTAQVELLQPQVIVALGEYASKILSGRLEKTLAMIHGFWFTWEKLPLLCTQHPGALLASADPESVRQMLRSDLKMVLVKLKELECR